MKIMWLWFYSLVNENFCFLLKRKKIFKKNAHLRKKVSFCKNDVIYLMF